LVVGKAFLPTTFLLPYPQPETHPNPPCLGREPDTAESNNKKSSLSREDLGGSLPKQGGLGWVSGWGGSFYPSPQCIGL